MKTVHLIRHAKSSWSRPHLSDIDRPLNNRGQRACGIMAQPIVDAGCSFEHVFCSVARRAQLTIEGLADALVGQDVEWQLDEELYTFSFHHLLNWVTRLDDAMDNVVVIGHNPAITDFCNGMGNQYIRNVPTCGYVQLVFAGNKWRDLSQGSGKLVTFLTPKMVK